MTVVITIKATDNAKNRRKMRRASEREEREDSERQVRLDYYTKNRGCIYAARAVSRAATSPAKQQKANPEPSLSRINKSNSRNSLTCRARQKMKLGEKPLIK
ncbi:hypothetical protein [Candidatus Pantoea soli]|uniref:hypothetical protein n=1 Tax=Candidatus Pantoea soli TaxID=3098669 RepID=UPI0011A3AAB2|nr:hypothetical protein [Pantoea soli]